MRYPASEKLEIIRLVEGSHLSARRTLAPGETLVILSDGPGDALGAGGERFGDERVRETISAAPAHPTQLVNALLEATATFSGNRPQADDQTLLAVAFR
jgi:sigma-B regulation protein RsbU (phosphoserine phosphatase)